MGCVAFLISALLISTGISDSGHLYGIGAGVARELDIPVTEMVDAGPLENGTAVYFPQRDLAFWVEGDKTFVVNERAKAVAPAFPQAPEKISYLAVWDASCRDDLARYTRPTLVSMAGALLTDEEVRTLEEGLQAHPDDTWAHSMLIGHYGSGRFHPGAAAKRWEEHVLWFVKNAPEHPVISSPDAALDPMINQDAFREASRLLKERLHAEPNNVRLLYNVGKFLLHHENDFAVECLKKCTALEPSNERWAEELAHAYSLQSRYPGMSGKDSSESGANALAELERAMQLDQDSQDKIILMPEAAEAALAAGNLEKATKYANEVLAMVKAEPEWDRANEIHSAHGVLGRIAVEKGDIEAAKEHLIQSAQVTGSPQLNTFGPDMTLAQQLLEKGERATVIEYLKLCGAFWEEDVTEKWVREIEGGETPDLLNPFSRVDFDSAAQGYVTSLITLPLDNAILKLLDMLYSLPLLALICALLMLRLFSSLQHIWILAPLGFIYVMPIVLCLLFPRFVYSLFGIEPWQFQHLLATYFGSLALVWLLSDILAWIKFPGALACAGGIMGVGGFMGIVNYPYAYCFVAEVLTFITVVLLSFVLARAITRRRYSRARFVAFLFLFNVSLMLFVWPVAFSLLALTDELTMQTALIVRHLIISLVNGVGLFVCLIPFALLAFHVPLYRQQFRTLMGLDEA